MFSGCITNNTLPISKDTKGGARGAKALTTHEILQHTLGLNFVCDGLGAKFGDVLGSLCPRGCHRGRI